MSICRHCKTSGKSGKFISASYCEVCGFAFLTTPSGEPTDITCLKVQTYQQAVEMGLLRADGSTVEVVEERRPVRSVEAAPAGTSGVDVDSNLADAANRIHEVVQREGLVGKSRILELSGVNESLYTPAIKHLLEQGRIESEGAGRGMKYRKKS